MGRTRIKICGITRVEDALAAARCGADFVGLVLHADSPRTVSLERARRIIGALPASVTPVALFVDAPADQLRESCRTLGITHAQLHGHETPEYVESLGLLSVWKMLPVEDGLRDRVRAWRSARVDAVLLETGGTGVPGGSGRENDWRAVAAVRDALDDLRFIAAGGLNPHNVADVVRELRPWAVDVSSGVEGSVKGIKSHEGIESFIRAVRAADQSL